MSKSSYSYSFLKGIVICHGKSEKLICEFLRSNLRIQIEIDSDKKGKKSIQITSIMKFLSGEKYKNIASFKNKFDDIEQIKDKKKLPSYFKIFIIMDTDDLVDVGIKFQKSRNERKSEYPKVFPMNGISDIESIKKFGNRLKKSKKTNMEEFIDFCLELIEK